MSRVLPEDDETVLVLAAHPDDEVLGCGGTIPRLAEEGHHVEIVILGEGVTARYEDPDDAPASEIEALHETARKVGEFLGAEDVHLIGLPDNRFDTVPLLDVIRPIERHVADLEPSVVFTQHAGDLNVDHQRLFQATLTATRPTGDQPVRELYAYEVGSSSEWSFRRFAPDFRPTTFVDVSRTLDRRIEALKMYESEVRPAPHPRSPESQRAIAARWGSVAGMEAAEAFELIRSLRE